MDARSETNHAGVPAKVTTTFSVGAGAESLIVASPGDGRKIKLHDFMVTVATTGRFTLASSGVSTETSLIGGIHILAGTPVHQEGGHEGLGTCVVDADLSASSVVAADGNVTYSLIP